MKSKKSRRATVRKRLGGATGWETRYKDALATVLSRQSRTQARLAKTLEAIRNVVEGRAAVESLKPFLNEPLRFPRLKYVTKEVRELAKARTGSN